MHKFISLILFFILFTPLFAGGEGEMALLNGTKPLSMAAVEDMFGKKDVYILDVNTNEEHDEFGYLPNAIFINVEGYEKLLPQNKDAILIIYGLNRLSFTASQAAITLQEKGYKNVYVMPDGLEAWVISGRKVNKPEVKAVGNLTTYDDGIHKNMIFGEVPACRDCHGKDNTKNKKFVNSQCGSCHKEVNRNFSTSVHSKMAKHDIFKANQPLPQCSDCHLVHTTQFANLLSFKQASDKKCGQCHEEQQSHYYETFHGKAMLLNLPGKAPSVAACYDCHGAHNIFRVADDKSTLSYLNRTKTCSKCHIGSNDDFAFGFIAHADHKNNEKYPQLYYAYVFMTGLVIMVFAFFGLHTFLWSLKLISLRLKYPKEFKIAKANTNDVQIRRFTKLNMIMHFFVAASFLALAFSGLPQKFYLAPWANYMISLMGGPIMATKIHHISAFIMITCFLIHIVEIFVHNIKNKENLRDENGKINIIKALFGPDSLMPRIQDFRDMVANFKWFLGIGQRPQFDRWTYWEKFDYLAVFWGMFVIGFSGLVMWFPTFFAKFLPDFFINLSTIVHSDEALLATGFIFAVHFFNTHFRADRFPMDTVIFSGHVSQEEIKKERKYWYDRLKASGKFDELVVKNSRFNLYKWVAKFAGFAMLITGLIFLFLIVYAYVYEYTIK